MNCTQVPAIAPALGAVTAIRAHTRTATGEDKQAGQEPKHPGREPAHGSHPN